MKVLIDIYNDRKYRGFLPLYGGIGKRTDSDCDLCGKYKDTAEHLLCNCPAFITNRHILLSGYIIRYNLIKSLQPRDISWTALLLVHINSKCLINNHRRESCFYFGAVGPGSESAISTIHDVFKYEYHINFTSNCDSRSWLYLFGANSNFKMRSSNFVIPSFHFSNLIP